MNFITLILIQWKFHYIFYIFTNSTNLTLSHVYRHSLILPLDQMESRVYMLKAIDLFLCFLWFRNAQGNSMLINTLLDSRMFECSQTTSS